jgi:hypothetical protein
MSLWNTVNKVCGELPEGYQINLCMENGSAWIECITEGNNIELPDSTDKNLQFELNDALITACNHHRQRGKATS